MSGPDTLSLVHQSTLHRSLQNDMRVTTLRKAGVRLNHRQIRLFCERYVHVFELWFRLQFFYRSFFAYYVRDWTCFMYDHLSFFFVSSLYSLD